MKVGMWCFYVVGRPPAKFHRILRLFVAQTIYYSDNIVGQTSDIFGLRKQSSGLSLFSLLLVRGLLHSPLPTHRQALPKLSCQLAPSSCASEIVPDPTRAVVTVRSGSSPNVYKTSPFSYLDFLAILFAIIRLRLEGQYTPKSTHLLYI